MQILRPTFPWNLFLCLFDHRRPSGAPEFDVVLGNVIPKLRLHAFADSLLEIGDRFFHKVIKQAPTQIYPLSLGLR